MPAPRRTPLRLWLLALVLLPAVSLPTPIAPPPPHLPVYFHVHASTINDLELPPLLPVAPASACAGENLHRHVAKWQRLLRLEDWQLTIYCGLPSVLDGKTVDGRLYAYPKRRLAYIYVDPDSADPLEVVVLHELLHVAVNEARFGAFRAGVDPNEYFVELLTQRLYRSPAQ